MANLFDVFPGSTIHDGLNGRSGDAELDGENPAAGSALSEQADCSHIDIVQLRLAVRLTSRQLLWMLLGAVSLFPGTVAGVFSRRAEPQVFRTNTQRDVAFVKHPQPIGNIAVVENPRDAMGRLMPRAAVGFRSNPELAVSVGESPTGPQPTPFRHGPVNPGPKPLRNRTGNIPGLSQTRRRLGIVDLHGNTSHSLCFGSGVCGTRSDFIADQLCQNQRDTELGYGD